MGASAIIVIIVMVTAVTHYVTSSRAVAQSPAEIRTEGDVTTGKRAPADAQDNKRLLDAAQQLAAANEWCHLAFSDQNRNKPLGVQKRDDLQGCLWARYATEQAAQGSKPLSRAEWLQKTQLDARCGQPARCRLAVSAYREGVAVKTS